MWSLNDNDFIFLKIKFYTLYIELFGRRRNKKLHKEDNLLLIKT